jgi:hypothetical protein
MARVTVVRAWRGSFCEGKIAAEWINKAISMTGPDEWRSLLMVDNYPACKQRIEENLLQKGERIQQELERRQEEIAMRKEEEKPRNAV